MSQPLRPRNRGVDGRHKTARFGDELPSRPCRPWRDLGWQGRRCAVPAGSSPRRAAEAPRSVWRRSVYFSDGWTPPYWKCFISCVSLIFRLGFFLHLPCPARRHPPARHCGNIRLFGFRGCPASFQASVAFPVCRCFLHSGGYNATSLLNSGYSFAYRSFQGLRKAHPLRPQVRPSGRLQAPGGSLRIIGRRNTSADFEPGQTGLPQGSRPQVRLSGQPVPSVPWALSPCRQHDGACRALVHAPGKLALLRVDISRLFSMVMAPNAQTFWHLPHPMQPALQAFITTAPLSFDTTTHTPPGSSATSAQFG